MNDVYDIVEWFYRNYFFQHIHHMFHLYSFSLNFFITPIFPTQNWYLNIKFILTCNSNYVYIFFAEVRTCLFLLTILVSHTGTHFLHTNHTHKHTHFDDERRVRWRLTLLRHGAVVVIARYCSIAKPQHVLDAIYL